MRSFIRYWFINWLVINAACE